MSRFSENLCRPQRMINYIQSAKRKKKNLPPRVLYLENLFFRIEGEIKEFSKQAKATYERNQC